MVPNMENAFNIHKYLPISKSLKTISFFIDE